MREERPFAPTYVTEQGPAALAFDVYATQAMAEWRVLLDEDPRERRVQQFLEQHPALVPGSLSPGGATCGSELFNLLVSQPTLPGLDARQPDFLWFTSTSDTWYAVLLEIEAPGKRLFRRDGVPTAEFNQARNQLNQWRSWFGLPTNQLKFQADYGVPEFWTARRAMAVYMLLVYGRRNEFRQDPSLTRQRSSLLSGEDEELMSFDRLVADRFLADAITVRAKGNGRYRALSLPPTFKLGPSHPERLLRVDGLEGAIHSSEGWSAARRAFVTSRIPYWRDWAMRDDKGWIDVSDEE
jgi:hypothetical protein